MVTHVLPYGMRVSGTLNKIYQYNARNQHPQGIVATRDNHVERELLKLLFWLHKIVLRALGVYV